MGSSPPALPLVLRAIVAAGVRASKVHRVAICGLFMGLASCALLSAQNVVLTGSLFGRVTDQSKAVVPGATVVVQNLGTGVKISAETNRAGFYSFPEVMPGTYRVSLAKRARPLPRFHHRPWWFRQACMPR